MRIIPAIDIMGGKCVRLTKGDFSKATQYSEDPLEVALQFEKHGLQYLHLVDLDGAKAGKVQNLEILKKISDETKLKVDFSGGINSLEMAEEVFSTGASQIIIGSLAVKQPAIFESILQEFGPEKVILGADSRNGQIALSGWLENSEIELLTFIRKQTELGVKHIMSTSIAKDGALEGPDFDMYKEILGAFDVNLIASGGVRSLEDIEALSEIGCSGVIVGKAFYEGRISLQELATLC